MNDKDTLMEGFGIEPDEQDELNTTVPSDDIIDDEIPTEDEPTDADLSDQPEPEADDEGQSEADDTTQVEETQDEVVSNEPLLGNYRIIGQLPVFDKLGQAIPPRAIGQVYELPVEYGHDLVDQGLAVLVE